MNTITTMRVVVFAALGICSLTLFWNDIPGAGAIFALAAGAALVPTKWKLL